jgi:hypothetical protein
MRNLRWNRIARHWYESDAVAGMTYTVGPDRPTGYFVEARPADEMRKSEILARGMPIGEARRIAARHASIDRGR